ncbi:ShlB/FhaC/HecB family hemolysin secretion/activation protein [Xanthobacter oligotrophicus]|uniref:ShlB/FhaC/HecB family hemolysin secretion/activation protein n=2 Tax=Xanthobacter oligotrophicus TaxID=2607286 RepID=UPI0011F10551|nr:ShlB/FhaC/HecB family hemolysin secretion/activation protein [Xanthobacter oligotrophicus]
MTRSRISAGSSRPGAMRVSGLALAAAVGLLAPASALAQGLPFNIGDAVRDAQQSQQAAPQPQQVAPLVLPRLAEPQLVLPDTSTLHVRHIAVTGTDGLAVSEEKLRAVLAPYEGRKLTLAEIYEAADKVTALYRDTGYLVAKVYVPQQDARKGTLTFKLVPGRYGQVTVKNDSRVRDFMVRGTLDTQKVLPGELIEQARLERAMLLISDLAGAGMPRAVIGAGATQGASDVLFDVPEQRLIDGFLMGDNFGTPYTGIWRASGGFNINSPLGIGDRLSVFGLVSNSTDMLNGRVAYSLPLGYDGLRAEVAAFRTTYALGDTYADLDATGVADGVSATLLYPFKRSRADSIWGSAVYTYKNLNDETMGVSYAHRTINEGTVGLNRDTSGVLFGLPVVTSAAVAFTFGNVDFPEADQALANLLGADTQGDFSKLTLSFVMTVALLEKLSLSVNVRGQKSFSGNLDSSEQFSLTGIFGVRSYYEGLSGDSGWLVTPELKYALPDIYGWHHAVSAFADVGGVALENGAYTITQPDYVQLADIGLGYYGNYEYSPGRNLLLKAYLAWSVGGNEAEAGYSRGGTVGLIQAGFTF